MSLHTTHMHAHTECRPTIQVGIMIVLVTSYDTQQYCTLVLYSVYITRRGWNEWEWWMRHRFVLGRNRHNYNTSLLNYNLSVEWE